MLAVLHIDPQVEDDGSAKEILLTPASPVLSHYDSLWIFDQNLSSLFQSTGTTEEEDNALDEPVENYLSVDKLNPRLLNGNLNLAYDYQCAIMSFLSESYRSRCM